MRTEEKEVFEYVLTKHQDITNNEVDTLLNEFKKSNLMLEEFLLDIGANQMQMGGGCTVSILSLDDGNIFVSSDEAGAIFKNEELFLNDEGISKDLSIKSWWYVLNR